MTNKYLIYNKKISIVSFTQLDYYLRLLRNYPTRTIKSYFITDVKKPLTA